MHFSKIFSGVFCSVFICFLFGFRQTSEVSQIWALKTAWFLIRFTRFGFIVRGFLGLSAGSYTFYVLFFSAFFCRIVYSKMFPLLIWMVHRFRPELPTPAWVVHKGCFTDCLCLGYTLVWIFARVFCSYTYMFFWYSWGNYKEALEAL